MNERVLSIILKLRDEASKELQTFGTRVESLQPQFKKMATVGAVGFTAVAGAIALSVKEASEMESTQRRLEKIVMNATGATLEQTQALHKQAKALEGVGVVDAKTIASAQAKLATFDLTIDAIKELTPAILDVAVAEYGLGVSSEQITNLANGFGKALQGNTELLTKQGFKLTEHQKLVLETGTEVERLAMMNEILGKTYGGLNEEMANTTEGAMVRFKNQIGAIKDSIGMALLPAITNIVGAIQPMLQRFSDWAEANPKTVQTIAMVALGVTGLLTVIGLLGLALPVIISGFALLFSPITLVIGAIAGLVALFFTFREELTLIFENLFISTGILDTFKLAWDSIKESVSGLWTSLMELWNVLEPVLLPVLKLIGTVIGVALVLSIKALVEILKVAIKFFTDVFAIVSDIASFFINGFAKAIDTVVTRVEALIDAIRRAIALIAESGIGKAIGGAFSGIKNIFGGKKQSVNDAIISPRGDIITTHPDDWLIATKDPRSLGGGSGSVVVNISGNSFMGEEDMAEKVGDKILNILKYNVKLT